MQLANSIIKLFDQIHQVSTQVTEIECRHHKKALFDHT